ncbi:hypothetical protein GGTG_05594 [Gaeumannomyces tritici R3-111a-1]|uniref:Nucleoporin NUP37 n=1 Tax=Gaeumannomyces tritici (strain R3-111a-1) TaxID=644352 RepID=J3NWD0_GAET3|nr:hypothetical protein GGTG_05594 [Gaeumannomyces tritici R3-111a-1]EJT75662.1 hypothetical protein GGTG_05594 [Gaeumannomyces tritici R3-111a-1]
MMAASSAPRIRRTAQNTQYTYNLNQHVYDVKTYPVRSPQGATIVVYGHENGITVVWRGGRRLKPPKKDVADPATRDKRNGGSDDAVMIIDSDDEEPPPTAKPFVDKPEFEDADLAGDSQFPDTVQTLDLALGTAVRHIAVLPSPHSAAEDAAWGGAEILKGQMVFAVTCLNADVFLVTLPLTPPSHESKSRPDLRGDLRGAVVGKGLFGETLVPLCGQAQYSDALAITLGKQAPAGPEGHRKSAGRSSSQATRVIVAAHSRQGTGVLRLWDVSIGIQRPASERPLEPFQTEYLPSPLASLCFNPLHTTQLLAVASPHAVRIYDYSIPSVPQDESDGPLPSQGSWLVSLYTPFIRGSEPSTARKPVIAAAWISYGRAVLVLLADGQWGIWDIDGAGPSVAGSTPSAGGLFSKANSGVRGAALTTFSVSGYLEGTSPLRNPGAQKSSADLVPMTPHTRREALSVSLGSGPGRLAAVRGGVDIVQLPGRSPSSHGDESAVVWMGGVDHIVAVVPSVGRFWDAQARRSGGGGGNNIFDRGGGTQAAGRMVRLADISLGLLGERCCGVVAIPRAQPQQRRLGADDHLNGHSSQSDNEKLSIEVLIRGESRLVSVRDAEDDMAVHSFINEKLSASRRRALGPAQDVVPPPAIVPHPRPGVALPQGAAVLAQSLGGIGSMRASTRGKKSLFGKRPGIPSFDDEDSPSGRQDRVPAFARGLYDADEPTLTQSMMGARPRDTGFGFTDQLEDAANADDDEEAANERNVEEEILDIMEIDRALEDMEGGGGAGGFGSFGPSVGGATNVFFETS